MSKTRIFDLAKELGIQPAKLVASLQELGVEVANHSSTVDDATADLVRELFTGKAAEEAGKVVEVPQTVVVRELADLLGVEPAEVQKSLIEIGVLAALTQSITYEQAEKIAPKFGVKVKLGQAKPAAKPKPKAPKKAGRGPWVKPPVVTVLGHVDHGKTSLLDVIRNTHVTDGEFGGITQHIGAYQVTVEGKVITFIDTPGHEAFTAMRARGAQVTDIAVLVVAADDGVMPQTREAIDHARAAEVPIIVAVNKIDKANANPDHVKQQLSELELVPEDWGGDTIMVPVSAIKRTGIKELLDSILLQAEMMELTADPAGEVKGVVIESKLEKGRGAVATVLIQDGTLKTGQCVVVGSTYGKIKAMTDDKGERLHKAGPATPVELLGLQEVPAAGDTLSTAANDKAARQVAEERAEKDHHDHMAASARVSLEDLYRKLREGETKELNVVLRADVDGTAEAIRQSLHELGTDEVSVNVLQSAVGNIGEGDVLLAAASGAIIIGFNVRADKEALAAAERENVEIRVYNIIYELLDDVRKAMAGLLEPELKESILGHAEARATFRTPSGTVAGSYVQDGKISRNCRVRVKRADEVVFEGALQSLRRFKDDVREIASGFECGIQVAGFNDFQEGDIIEAYVMEEVARTL